MKDFIPIDPEMTNDMSDVVRQTRAHFSETFTPDEALKHPTLINRWTPAIEVAKGEFIFDNGEVFEVLVAHVTSEDMVPGETPSHYCCLSDDGGNSCN